MKENDEKNIKKNKKLNPIKKPNDTNLMLKTNNYNLKKPLKKFESVRNYDNTKRAQFNIFKESNNNVIIKENSQSKDCYRINSINLNKSINFKTLIFPQNNKIIIDEQNSSVSNLKENNNNNINSINKNKKNILDIENNKLNINKIGNIKNEKMKKAFTGFMKKEDINKFWLTKESLAKIDHKHKRLEEILDNNNKESKKAIKQISFIQFLKDIILENTKASNYFLIKFRKHLLSEEHLFKSHIKMILLEKEFNSKNAENTNVFECFNEL